jgi:hypothetical protein
MNLLFAAAPPNPIRASSERLTSVLVTFEHDSNTINRLTDQLTYAIVLRVYRLYFERSFLLSPPCLTTVSQECCRKPSCRQTLRTPVFCISASHSLSSPSTHIGKHTGGIPCDHNSPHPTTASAITLRPLAFAVMHDLRFLPRSCTGAALLRPNSARCQPLIVLFVPPHYVSFLFPSFAFACSKLSRSDHSGVNETRPHS